MKRLALAVLLFSFLLTPARAVETHVIDEDGGGIVLEYIARYWQWRAAGDKVRIEGFCASACTVLLGVIEPSNMCATRNAEFGFHSATYGPGGSYAEDGTQTMWMFYRGRTARVLAKNGWPGPSEHPELLMIDAQELVRPCKWEDYHG